MSKKASGKKTTGNRLILKNKIDPTKLMSSKKYKGLHGLKPWQNENYIATKEGQVEYDKELAHLQENRRRYDGYLKTQAAKRKKSETKKYTGRD